MASGTKRLFGILVSALILVVIVILVNEFILEATNVTGVAATVLRFIVPVLAVIGLALILKEAGL